MKSHTDHICSDTCTQGEEVVATDLPRSATPSHHNLPEHMRTSNKAVYHTSRESLFRRVQW
jgi:hypothetical protein